MTGLLIRLAILIAIFVSVFLVSQVVLGHLVNRRSERRAINRRLTMLRAGIDREEVSLSLLKNAPPTLAPDAGIFERMEVRFIRMVMMSGVIISSNLLIGMNMVN